MAMVPTTSGTPVMTVTGVKTRSSSSWSGTRLRSLFQTLEKSTDVDLCIMRRDGTRRRTPAAIFRSSAGRGGPRKAAGQAEAAGCQAGALEEKAAAAYASFLKLPPSRASQPPARWSVVTNARGGVPGHK